MQEETMAFYYDIWTNHPGDYALSQSQDVFCL